MYFHSSIAGLLENIPILETDVRHVSLCGSCSNHQPDMPDMLHFGMRNQSESWRSYPLDHKKNYVYENLVSSPFLGVFLFSHNMRVVRIMHGTFFLKKCSHFLWIQWLRKIIEFFLSCLSPWLWHGAEVDAVWRDFHVMNLNPWKIENKQSSCTRTHMLTGAYIYIHIYIYICIYYKYVSIYYIVI